MDSFHLWSVFVCLSAALGVTSDPFPSVHQNALQVEERIGRFSVQPLKKMQGVLKNEAFKAGIPDLLANAGAIGTLTKIDYSAPPKEVFKQVGDASIGIITTGLSMIPGGTIIGGIVAGVWGLFAPFLGGAAAKSPMELMIDGIKEELSDIKREINEMKNAMNKMAKEITEKNRKETDQKISQLVNRAIQGALNRNQYVCSKYSVLSGDFVEDMKKNGSVDEFMRVEMVGLIHSCDNFLKDTAESFVFPEYADVLWVPSAITTMVRVAFLSEISNYGVALKMDPLLIRMFFTEMKKDIQRHFDLAFKGFKKRQETFINGETPNKANLTDSEYEGCKLQSQLLYFDRQIYPHGVPKQRRIFDDDEEINVADFNVTGNDEPHHTQIYYNEIGAPQKKHKYQRVTFLNCFLGAPVISRVPKGILTLTIIFVPDKTYVLRALFFAKEYDIVYIPREEQIMSFDLSRSVRPGTLTNERTVTMLELNENEVEINIDMGIPEENRNNYIRTKGYYHLLSCPSGTTKKCLPNGEASSGYYTIVSVAEIDIDAGSELKKKFIISNGKMPLNDPILAMELIILPKVK